MRKVVTQNSPDIQVSGLFDLAERTAGFPRIEVRSYACSVDGNLHYVIKPISE